VYLLDTNVISELRKPRPHGGVVAWVAAADEAHLFLSVVTRNVGDFGPFGVKVLNPFRGVPAGR